MPRLLLLLAVLFLCGFSCGTKPLHFVIAGQSNASGASTQATPAVDGIGMSFGHDHVWRTANDPTIHFPGETWRSSAWPQLIAERHGATGRSTRLVATARGDRCLVYRNATSGEEPPWRPGDGWAYADMLDSVTASGLAVLDAVLWYQGECDATAWWKDPAIDAQQAYDDYLEGLLALGDAVQRDLGIPLVVAPVSLRWCRWSNPSCDPAQFEASSAMAVPIHDASVDAAASHPGILLGPFSDDLRLQPDNLHIHDVNELGRRWAAALEAAGL